MSVKRLVVLALAPALFVASGCASTLGRSMPDCDETSATTIISVQSVPGTHYVPCINGLRPGWDYHHLRAENGRSEFWLDSDRMGTQFITVRLESSCDLGASVPAHSDEAGIPRFIDVEADIGLDVTIVPEGRSAQAVNYATEIQLEIQDETVRGRTLMAHTDTRLEPTQDRIAQARSAGHVVIVVGPRDEEEDTGTLILPGVIGEREIDRDDLVDEIESAISEQSYRGWWYYPFTGGCVTYEFNARGDGVATIEEDVELALGLFDAEALRQVAQELGYEVP